MKISRQDRTLILGSCFAANVGNRLAEEGFDVCLNPFGTIFNPASICNSIKRLDSAEPFREEECVMMGAGAGLWCSFSHYTRFARPSKEEFLAGANEALKSSSEFFKGCDRVILTFGTAWVFRHGGMVVTNCLKLPSREFSREILSVDEIVGMYRPMLAEGGCLHGKEVLFTVSPIRHLADGAHGNQVSKATLLLAIDTLCREFPNCSYFPAYEIVLDELRDYRWYAEDKVHPSDEAVAVIWDHFKEAVLE